MKLSYSHLVKHIVQKPTIAELSTKLFQLGHEHEIKGDIFDIEFTPNRGDCLSIKGLLKDLAAFYMIEFDMPSYDGPIDVLNIDFENKCQKMCPKISFLKIEIEDNIQSYQSELKAYFEDLNNKPINFFTDISNFLAYETGQPTHAYDASIFNKKVLLTEISDSCEFTTLLNNKILLTNENNVFCVDNEIINLAGVIGGKNSACRKETKSAIIECAYFLPDAIIGKTIKYDIKSEAAYKFERGVDPEIQDYVLRRFISIVQDHVKIKNMQICLYDYMTIPKIKIPFNTDKINKILGINISDKKFENILLKLGFKIHENYIKVPSYRNDIKTQNDLAEEVARIIGYDNIEAKSLSLPSLDNNSSNTYEKNVKGFLVDNGFFEVINFPFVSQRKKMSVKVDNPLDSNKEFLRTDLKTSLLNNLLYNERRQKEIIKLFEISDIYSFEKGQINKKKKLALIATGRVGKNHLDFSKKINSDFLESILIDLIPQRLLSLESISRDNLDTKLKDEILFLEVDFDQLNTAILEYSPQSRPPKKYIEYNKISELPSSNRDVSFSIKDFSELDKLEEIIRDFKNDILKEKFVFDYFHNEKNNEIKLGYRFIFQSKLKTLTDSEINIVLNDIIKEILKLESVSIPGLKQ